MPKLKTVKRPNGSTCQWASNPVLRTVTYTDAKGVETTVERAAKVDNRETVIMAVRSGMSRNTPKADRDVVDRFRPIGKGRMRAYLTLDEGRRWAALVETAKVPAATRKHVHAMLVGWLANVETLVESGEEFATTDGE